MKSCYKLAKAEQRLALIRVAVAFFPFSKKLKQIEEKRKEEMELAFNEFVKDNK